MKLKEIPQNTVVHTPTEDEVRELLAILHENGYKWCGGSSLIEDSEWYVYEAATCYFISSYVEFDNIHKYNQDKIKPITLAEFKEKYCEMTEQLTEKAEEGSVIPEKPQPKFRLGERIRIVSSGEEDFINMITKDDCYELLEHRGKYIESDLEPYAEPETKTTEDMETKELNLCELLKGHEGIIIYSPLEGEVRLEGIRPKDNYMIKPIVTEGGHSAQMVSGKRDLMPFAVYSPHAPSMSNTRSTPTKHGQCGRRSKPFSTLGLNFNPTKSVGK